MMARRGALGVLAGGLALLLAGCGRKRSTLRFRLTVEVNTPRGMKSGSSVLENVHIGRSAVSLPEENGSHETYGQAPFVDLGNGQYVFALLHDQNYRRSMQEMVLKVLSDPEVLRKLGLNKEADGYPPMLYPAANDAEISVEIKPKHYPMLVTFDDITNPKTVREVNLGDMSAALGSGYSIERITMQVVGEDEPLTAGIEDRLKWIGKYPETPLIPMTPGAPLEPVGVASLGKRLSNANFVYRGDR